MSKKKTVKKKTVKKKTAKKKESPGDNGFEAWLAESRGCRLWDRWPDGAIAEISKVLEYNDRGDHQVSAARMAERLRDVYSAKLSTPSLTKYCQEVLGRGGWRRR